MTHNTSREYARVAVSSPEDTAMGGSVVSSSTTGSVRSDSSIRQQSVQAQQSLSLSDSSTCTSTGTVRNHHSTDNHHHHNHTTSSSLPSRTVSERIMDKVVAAGWVLLAALVFHYTDSVHVYCILPSDDHVAPPKKTANIHLLQLVMIGLGINTVLFLYLLLYLPYIKGLNDSSAWDVYCPRIIPTITITSVVLFILLIRATWPVWGFLSPLIIGIEAVGSLFVCHFIPVGFL
jgi:hypothetical protein